jgi:hypothetical protein
MEIVFLKEGECQTLVQIVIIVSYNCRGLGNRSKETSITNLIKSEKPKILLLQETKMDSLEAIKIGKWQWRLCQGITKYSRGTSRGLCTLWNTQVVTLEFSYQT